MTRPKYPQAGSIAIATPKTAGSDSDALSKCNATIQVLIDGLCATDGKLRAACWRALVRWGELIAPMLHTAAAAAGLPPARRQRIAEVIGQLGPTSAPELTVDVTGALQLAARSPDDLLCCQAARAVAMIVPKAADFFIEQAVANLRQAAICVRLLKAAEYTGQQPHTGKLIELTLLGESRNPQIRAQATRYCQSFGTLGTAIKAFTDQLPTAPASTSDRCLRTRGQRPPKRRPEAHQHGRTQ